MAQDTATQRRIPIQTIVTAGVAVLAIVVAIVLGVMLATNNASASRALHAATAKTSKLQAQVSECRQITAAMSDALTDLEQANSVYNAAALAGDLSSLSDGQNDQAAALASLQSVKVKDCR